MPILPFNAAEISATHSQLTAVLAGFALAALFLLIERVSHTTDSPFRKQYVRAMLLLFVDFLVGSLSSFLYSSIVGDTPIKAFFNFLFPSCNFAIQAIVLLCGMNLVFSALGKDNILTLARRISYVVVIFSVERIWNDLSYAAEFFGTAPQIMRHAILLPIFIVPLAVSFLLQRNSDVRVRFEERTFDWFCYTVAGVSFGIGFIQGVQNLRPETQLVFSIWMPVVLMLCVSAIGAWAILLLPHRLAEKNTDQA